MTEQERDQLLKRLEASAQRIERDHGERLERIECIQRDHGERLERIERDHGEKLKQLKESVDGIENRLDEWLVELQDKQLLDPATR